MWSGASIGSTPFGFGTPVAAPEPATKGPALSRYINPGSGEYEIDPIAGQFADMPSIRQRVLLIAKTELGSSTALPDLGIRRPKKIDQAIEARMRAEILRAFNRLTTIERVIEIKSIEIVKLSSGRLAWTMEWIDLTTFDPATSEQKYQGIL